MKIITVLILFVLISTANAVEYTVSSGESIQAAINNASDGDTINVGLGEYHENVVVNRTLTLIGDGAHIHSPNESLHTIKVESDWVNISGFEVTGATNNSAGIFVNRSCNCTIADNSVHDNQYGIYLTNASYCMVLDNSAQYNTLYAIDLINSTHTSVGNNIASHGDYCGIALYRSQYNLIWNNTACYNQGCAGILLYSECYNNVVLNNVITNNGEYGGILLFSECGNNSIALNEVSDNVGVYGGVSMYSCDPGNAIVGNRICNNEPYGMLLMYAAENLIYDNALMNNINVRDDGNLNRWNRTPFPADNIMGGQSLGGNWWSNYQGFDNDSDGFGDTPHSITEFASDYYPLIKPICGDVDMNGYLSANDVVEVYRLAVNPDHPVSRFIADVDGNTYISANDVVEVYRAAVDPAHELHCALFATQEYRK